MRTTWEEILCSFFQFLIVIRLLRASWEELFQACALTEGLKLVYFTPLCKGLSPLSCWVSVILLTLSAFFNANITEGWMFCGSFSLLVCRLLLQSLEKSMQQCHKKIIQMCQRQMNSSSLKKNQANKKTQQNSSKRYSFELWECCSYCKRSNFKAILL